MATDRLALDTPPFFGRPPEKEQLMVATYFNFSELQNTEHQTTRRYVEHGRQGKTLRSDIEASTAEWRVHADQHPGLVSAQVAPRPEVARVTHSSQAKRSMDAAAEVSKGATARSGGLKA